MVNLFLNWINNRIGYTNVGNVSPENTGVNIANKKTGLSSPSLAKELVI